MTPTSPGQLDVMASRSTAPKAMKSAAREFASLLAQFDEPAVNSPTGEAKLAEDPAGEAGNSQKKRPAPLTTDPASARLLDAAAKALAQTASGWDGEPSRPLTARAERIVPDLQKAVGRVADTDTGEIARQLGERLEQAGTLPPKGLPSMSELAQRAAEQEPELTPRVAATLMSAAEETARSLAQRVVSDRPAGRIAGQSGTPALAPDAAGQMPPSDDSGQPQTGPTARERFTLRLGPLADRLEQHVGRGEARQGDIANLPAKPLGQITVTRQETHLAPVRQSPVIAEHAWRSHIAPEVKAELRSDSSGKGTFAVVADQMAQALDSLRSDAQAKLQQATQTLASPARTLAPVKIVELSLQPASLGAIAITMRLTGTGLRVTVSATTRETADALREDRDALSALIADAGYDASDVIVTHRPPRDPQPGAA